MSIIKVTIPGKPTPKARPRLGKWGVYTPKETTDYERYVSEVIFYHLHKDKATVMLPICDPIKLVIRVYFNPAYHKENYDLPHTKRPDIDNLLKSLMDGLNRGIIKDDSQVYKVDIEKWLSRRNEVRLEIHY